jgi:hypothetical protein
VTTYGQLDIGYGDYFIRVWDRDLVIYGKVIPREELVADEKRLGADDRELSWTMNAHDKAYARGYRFGWCYSEAEPDGELGSTHVSSMLKKITKEEFEAAKVNGWR